MADILSAALTGDADFAGSIFGKKPEVQETEPQEPEIQEEIQDEIPQEIQETPPDPSPPNADVVTKKKAPVREATKKVKATTKEADDAVEKVTEKATKPAKTEDPSEDVTAGELPVNPHFQDKKVADKPEGDDTEKGVSSWKEIKAEMKKAREERDRLKAELESSKEKYTKFEADEQKRLRDEIENYKTQMAELSRELKMANFERSPEYTENIRKPVAAIQADLKAIAEANDTDFSKLWQAVAEPDVRRRADMLEDLTSDFKRMEQLAVIRMSEKVQDLQAYHQKMEQEAQAINEELAARNAQKEREFLENDSRLQKAFLNKNWTALEDKYDFLREIEGQDQWNSYIRSAKAGASETNLDRLSVEDRSAILAKAAVVPFLESALNHYTAQLERVSQEKDERIKELQAQVESYAGATPSLGKSSEEATVSDDEDDASLTNFGAAILGRR